MTLKRVVAYTPYPWEHALTTLRISGPLEQAGLEVIQGDKDPDRVSAADAVLIQRDFPRNINTYHKIRSLSRQQRKPLIYEIDDLLFELPEGHPYRSSDYFTPALLPMLYAIMDADQVTTTTPLLQKYLQSFNPRIHVLPNYLNDQLWKKRRLQPERAESPTVIGYMGSDSHLPDLELVVPAFKRLLDHYGEKIRVRFWGPSPPPDLPTSPCIEWTPISIPAYAEFAQYFCAQQCDIFVAPLADNPFNCCKSPIKFLEYSWLAVPGVYSSLAPYEGIVIHGQNGFLATTDREWEACLRKLIEDPALRQRMGKNALEATTKNWLLSHHAHEWKEVYQEASTCPSKNVSWLFHQKAKKSLGNILEQAQNWQAELQKILTQQENSVRDLSIQLEEIKSSDEWRWGNIIWNLRLKLLPRGSFREQFIRRLLRYLSRILH